MSDINKFTTKEVLNKVLLDSSGNSVAANSHTSQEALNAVLDTSNNRLNVSLGGSNTISGDVTITGDLTVQGGGSLAFDEIIQGSLKATANYDSGDNQGSVLFESNLGTAVGTVVDLFHNSASPAADDFVGLIRGMGNDSAGNLTEYGSIGVYISDPTNTGEDGYIRFNTSENGTASEAMRIDAAGNVGIGTDSPAQGQSTPISDIKLDVAGNQMLSNLSSTNSDESKLFFFRSDGAVGSQGAVPDGLKIGAIEWTALTSGDNNNSITSARIEAEAGSTWSSASNRNADITFSTIGANTLAERMRIDSSGNVGIGTENPNLIGTSGATTLSIQSASTSGVIELQDANAGTDGELGKIEFQNLNGGASVTGRALIIGSKEGSTHNSTNLQFYTMSSGTAAEAMRIDSSGNVGIGNAGTFDNPNSASKVLEIATASPVALILNDTRDANPFCIENRGAVLHFAHGTTSHMVLDTNSRISLSNNGGTETTVFGQEALNAGISGSNVRYSVAIGHRALMSEDSTDGVTAVGYQALVSQNQTGETGNTGIGYQSIYNNVTGTKNTAVGWKALKGTGSQSGSNITAIGSEALAVAYGQDNVAIGTQAGLAITSGVRNCLIGNNVGDAITDANYVTAVGIFAGSAINHTDANGTTLLGYSAGLALTSGQRNLAIGYQSLYQSDECDDSIAIGYEALAGTDAGTNNKNIAIGNYALDANLANSVNNIAIGYNALTAATGGQSNVAIGGSGAGGAITTADKIVAIGDGALGGAVQSDGNTGVGYASLYNATGEKNTAFGYQSSNTVTDGTQNTVIGWDADASASGAVNQTVIGSETTGVADNSVTLGNASVTDVYMAQDSGAIVHTAGIQFPASQVANGGANVLDDYEEATHIVTGTDAGGGTFTLNSGVDTLSYTKIGRQVTVAGELKLNDLSGVVSGELRFSLPFAVADLAEAGDRFLGAVSARNINFTVNVVSVSAKAVVGTQYFFIEEITDDGVETSVTGAMCSSNDELTVTLTYFTS